MPRAFKKTGLPAGKWRSILLVSVYKWARLGLSDDAIRRQLLLANETFHEWKRKRPELREALALGRKDAKANCTFAAYCYERLPEPLKEAWDKILLWESESNGVVKIEQMLVDGGEGLRQQLYLHALIHCNFSPSRAGVKVGVRRETIKRWLATDPTFAELVDEIQWHKGNYFEDQLVGLVAEGDPGAILFANKTFNRDRGYGAKVDVSVSGKVDHIHTAAIDLSELTPYLTEAVQTALMDAIRKRELEGSKRKVIPVSQSPEEQVVTQMNRMLAEEAERTSA